MDAIRPRKQERHLRKLQRLFPIVGLVVVTIVVFVLHRSDDYLVVGLALRPKSSSFSSSSSFQNSYPPRPGSPRDDVTTSSSSSKSNNNNNINNNKDHDVVKKIEFVNFWGTKVTLDDETPDATQRRHPRTVPCVPTLDPMDGPLPVGAYVEEGKQQYDAKTTCRISVAVHWGPNNNNNNNSISRQSVQQQQTSMCDPNDIVRRLQSCVDSGLNTFQLYDQQSQGLDIIGRMKQQTPSYVESHWSINLMVPTTMSNSIQETRGTVVRLLEQTKGDALDSLQVEYNPQSPYTLDVLDHLAELQREGFIRSIGLRNMPSSIMKEVITNGNFGRIIDFQQQSGNLLLPPREEFCYPGINLWMSNPLADGLLTDRYMMMSTQPSSSSSFSSSSRSSHGSLQKQPVPLLSTQAGRLLQEWATLKKCSSSDGVGVGNARESQQLSPPSSLSLSRAWSMYQTQVIQRLQWVALKHQVSVSAVALRWALEFGTTRIQHGPRRSNNKKNRNYNSNNNNNSGLSTTNRDVVTHPAIVSTTVVDCAFDTEIFEPQLKLLRQVFRFELDDEDRELLGECSVPAMDTPSSSSSSNKLGEKRNDWDEGRRIYQGGQESDDVEEEDMDEDYPEIDFNNRALWL